MDLNQVIHRNTNTFKIIQNIGGHVVHSKLFLLSFVVVVHYTFLQQKQNKQNTIRAPFLYRRALPLILSLALSIYKFAVCSLLHRTEKHVIRFNCLLYLLSS